MGVTITAQAVDGIEIVEAVRSDVPDVVILDIAMPPGDCGGFVAAERLRGEYPNVGILFLSAYRSMEYADRFMRCSGNGGKGYLTKERIKDGDMLLDVLECIANGDTRVDSEIIRMLANPQRRRSLLSDLTDRQIEVLELAAQGLKNRAIADQLNLSEKTAAKHVSDILDKLNIPASATTHRRSLMLLTYLRANHVCDARCKTPCDTIASLLHMHPE